MLNWQIEPLQLLLRYTWKISRNATDHKINLLVRVSDGLHHGVGEAAPNVRYSETAELLQQQFMELQQQGLGHVSSLEELQELFEAARPANALRFALESAYVHMLCCRKQVTVGQLLGVAAPGPVPTSFSLPIMQPQELPAFFQHHALSRFPSIKLKVNRELGEALVRQVLLSTEQPLIIDANEAWTDPDELLRLMALLPEERVLFVEQPMPASCTDEYKYLRKRSPFPIFADESVTDDADFDALREQFHGLNIKLMKAGGYLNGLRLLKQAQRHGLLPMVGCMVETSLGIWSAMQLCNGIHYTDLDGFLIVQNEPFGLVAEYNGRLFAQMNIPKC